MRANRLQELINVTHRHGVEIEAKIAELLKRKKWLEKLNAERRRELDAINTPTHLTLTMVDTTEPGALVGYTGSFDATAGYVNGKYQTARELATRYPHKKHLSIDVTGAEASADCLDVESGDASPRDVVPWYFRAKFRAPHRRPCFYGSRSTMAEIKKELERHGIARNAYRLWVADPTGIPHIPFGYDACQYAWNPDKRNIDLSLTFRGFWE